MASWLFWLIIILGGVAGAVQAPVNATLAQHIRPIPASLVSFIVGGTALLALTLFTLRGQGLSGLGQGLSTAPPWSFLGGLCGAMVVSSVIVGTGAIGANATLSLLTGVQLIAALVIDAIGFGTAGPIPIRWPQVLGVLLIIGGMKLVLTR
ncbi:DMT family transporter [Symbiobacterium thermophilum]|uniref:DMT family transporter n=1 Tax=Symbiobacterium thermophilum (strain DSM 24528 / JCM 14929 / IAM 14863 / T) TaxID=292459 RepID=Q67KE9_SYMTH|nr:DMT family transporter [Symbiobacterium thermophilum]BAD41849.1 conserved hypothetical protein [Symbiobacterium thermophilum IAM 14863]